MFRLLLSIILICSSGIAGWAQEFNCKVTIRHDKITGVDNQVFVNMEKSVNELINNHKWTSDEFGVTEKIDCNIMINLTSNNVGGDIDAYSGTLNIQATRPVYNTAYNTNLVNYVDKDIAFHFSQFNPLTFDDNQVTGTNPLASNLSAIIAYYAYLVLALDYDSFSPMGGTNMLKKAQSVVNNAPDAKGVSGWKAMEGQRNRYWIVDQLLNTRFGDARSFWYTMHREGLDSMSVKPTEARTRILVNLRKLYNVNRDNPSSILLQFIFNAKSDEIMHLLALAPKQERAQYVTLLSTMDVPNAAKYSAYR
jgi:hypothetical protein